MAPLPSGLDYGVYDYGTDLGDNTIRLNDALIHDNALHLLGTLEQDQHVVHLAIEGAGVLNIDQRFDDAIVTVDREFISGLSTQSGLRLISTSGREAYSSTSLLTGEQDRFTPPAGTLANIRRQNDALLVGGVEANAYQSVLVSMNPDQPLRKRYSLGQNRTLSFEDVARNGNRIMAVGVLFSELQGVVTILDAQGEVQNAVVLADYLLSQVRRVPQSKDFIVVGATSNSVFSGELLVFRLSSAGQVRWAKTFDYAGSPVDISLVVTSDRIIIAADGNGTATMLQSDLDGNVISSIRHPGLT